MQTALTPAPTIDPCPAAPAYTVQSLLEKGSSPHNEDALLTHGTLFAVFDGASCLTGQRFGGRTGAWWASRIARDSFRLNCQKNAPLTDLFAAANEALAAAMRRNGVNTADPLRLWSTSMAAVRLDRNSMEFVQTGDSLILCLTDDGHFMPAPYVNHDCETMHMWQEACCSGVDDVRSALHEQICAVRRNMNRDYGALNGTPAAGRFAKSGVVCLNGVRKIVLFTDGLHMPSQHPGETCDFAAEAAILRDHGLHRLYETVRSMERTDPLCRTYPRFKQHDDIAAIAVTLNSQSG